MVGGSYYFQNLAEFSKEIPFKTPKCPKIYARFARKSGVGVFIIFKKSPENDSGGFIMGGGGIINSPVNSYFARLLVQKGIITACEPAFCESLNG